MSTFAPDTERFLINTGADTVAYNKEGCMPIHLAAFRGHINVMEVFRELGFSFSAKSSAGSQGRASIQCLIFARPGRKMQGSKSSILTPHRYVFSSASQVLDAIVAICNSVMYRSNAEVINGAIVAPGFL
jgi:hypothetical protein